jgi:hypothetical protein
MDWSLSKVTRIEGGEVGITPNDLRALLPYLGVTDADEVGRLVDDAKLARRRRPEPTQWWSDPEYQRSLTPAMRQLVQFEDAAVEIRHFGIMLVAGIVQTREYAEAILEDLRKSVSDEDASMRIKSRLRRKQWLVSGPAPPRLYALLDESILYREIGNAEIMGNQLLELLRLAELDHVLVRIIPFAAAATIGLLGPFELVDLEGDDVVLYRESVLSDYLTDDWDECVRHRDRFEALWARALDDGESLKLIKGRAELMLGLQGAPAQSPPRHPKLQVAEDLASFSAERG